VKQTAQRIFRQTLSALDIPVAIEKKLVRNGPVIKVAGGAVDLQKFDEIVAIAFGKASFAMAEGIASILAPEFRPEGILVTPSVPPRELAGWRIFIGGHPLPNEASFAAGRAILDRLACCGERALVFFLLSGGGSSLVELPLDPGASLEDFQEMNRALVTCGAPIEEINAIRKHVSAIKGGRLATAASQSMKLTLAISDVPEGRESALASGPTLPDPTTINDVERIARKHGLIAKLPSSLRAALGNHSIQETPKQNDPAFARSHFELLLGQHELMHAAHHACEAEGYVCLCDHTADAWPVEKAADYLLGVLRKQLKAVRERGQNRPVAVLADGEVSCPVTGDGVGGRNSAFALACVPKIAGENIAVLSAGTDGIDGNSPAAGALADGDTFDRAAAIGLSAESYFRRSDAFTFFARLDDAVITGPTGNNLRDLRILLAHPAAKLEES